MNKFVFTYFPTKEMKYGAPVNRTVEVFAQSAPAAIDVFERTMGSLKKNHLVSIQEYDEMGEPFGEPITLDSIHEPTFGRK